SLRLRSQIETCRVKPKILQDRSVGNRCRHGYAWCICQTIINARVESGGRTIHADCNMSVCPTIYLRGTGSIDGSCPGEVFDLGFQSRVRKGGSTASKFRERLSSGKACAIANGLDHP